MPSGGMIGWSFANGAVTYGFRNGPPTETLKIIVPAHRPIKRSTLSHILKQAGLSVDELDALL